MEPSFENSTLAPNAFTASMQLMVSEDRRGCLIMDFPLAKHANRKALIVWLLEAGTSIFPHGFAGLISIIVLIMALYFAKWKS